MKICNSVTAAKYEINVPIYATAANLCGIVRKFLRAWWRGEPTCCLTFGTDAPTEMTCMVAGERLTWTPGLRTAQGPSTILMRDNVIVDVAPKVAP